MSCRGVCQDQLKCDNLTDNDSIFMALQLSEQQIGEVNLEILVGSVVESMQRWQEVLPHLDHIDEYGRRWVLWRQGFTHMHYVAEVGQGARHDVTG